MLFYHQTAAVQEFQTSIVSVGVLVSYALYACLVQELGTVQTRSMRDVCRSSCSAFGAACQPGYGIAFCVQHLGAGLQGTIRMFNFAVHVPARWHAIVAYAADAIVSDYDAAHL